MSLQQQPLFTNHGRCSFLFLLCFFQRSKIQIGFEIHWNLNISTWKRSLDWQDGWAGSQIPMLCKVSFYENENRICSIKQHPELGCLSYLFSNWGHAAVTHFVLFRDAAIGQCAVAPDSPLDAEPAWHMPVFLHQLKQLTQCFLQRGPLVMTHVFLSLQAHAALIPHCAFFFFKEKKYIFIPTPVCLSLDEAFSYK